MISSINQKISKSLLQVSCEQSLGMGTNQIIRYNYIRKKELDLIKGNHGDSMLEQFKVYSKQAKYIYKQGWGAFKHDIKIFYNLRKRLKDTQNPLSVEEKKHHKRMRQ